MTSMIMPSHNIFIIFFFIHILYSSTTEAQTNYLRPACSPMENFTANSAFQSNLNALLSSLASNNAANTEFYNTSVAGGGDTVYGLFMCRGDITPAVCRQCVHNAIQLLPSMCGSSKEAIIWYEECSLGYSNLPFSSTVDTRLKLAFFLWNTGDISDSDQKKFTNLLLATMNETADEAAKPALGEKKYATKEAKFSGSQTLYCLAQCTPDLSPQDCRRCLGGAIQELPQCCAGKAGGRALYPSCNVHYENFRFYNQPLGTTPPPPVSPTNSSNPQVNGKGQSTKTIVIVAVSLVGAGILFCVAYFLIKSQMKKSRRAVLRQEYFGSESSTLEPLQFSLATIEAATNKFSHENSLGKGGFGQVYKGILSNGQEIAVKRFLKGSGHGAKEFKNEVLLIARLQHRNLVALLGICIEEPEKILIYEYVPNRSLDYFLFDSPKSRILSWLERYKIIGGIARGILYLHEYSRLKIIHRDLKPSNILLDNEMNPKISDFGLAKMVAINESEGNTSRIFGTYGYMSPEYAMFGQYSEKLDVFSFGVIILEIISGKKNTSYHNQSQYADSLLSYAWNQWRDEKLLEILDSNLKELESYDEVIKCIQIGLLCVQANPDARPSMAKVVRYLTNDSIQLPLPHEPAFLLHGRMELSIGSKESCSTNEVSVSEFFPR